MFNQVNKSPGYRFTKAIMQNKNYDTNLGLHNIFSLK